MYNLEDLHSKEDLYKDLLSKVNKELHSVNKVLDSRELLDNKASSNKDSDPNRTSVNKEHSDSDPEVLSSLDLVNRLDLLVKVSDLKEDSRISSLAHNKDSILSDLDSLASQADFHSVQDLLANKEDLLRQADLANKQDSIKQEPLVSKELSILSLDLLNKGHSVDNLVDSLDNKVLLVDSKVLLVESKVDLANKETSGTQDSI